MFVLQTFCNFLIASDLSVKILIFTVFFMYQYHKFFFCKFLLHFIAYPKIKIPSVSPKIFSYTFTLSVNIWFLSFRQSYFLELLLILGPCFTAYVFFLSVIFLLLAKSCLVDIFPSLFRMTPNVFF